MFFDFEKGRFSDRCTALRKPGRIVGFNWEGRPICQLHYDNSRHVICKANGMPGIVVGVGSGKTMCQVDHDYSRHVADRLGKKSRSKKSKSKPKSKKSCDKANMTWVAQHKSKTAKGKKIMVRGSCRK